MVCRVGKENLFNHGTKHSKGVAIPFDPKFHVNVEKEIKCQSGRALILQICIDQAKYTCVNVYSPNDSNAQRNFYTNLSGTLQQFSSDSFIIGGDFNCSLNEQDKDRGRKVSSRASTTFLIYELMDAFELPYFLE